MDQLHIDEVWPDGFWEKVEELANIAAVCCAQLAEALHQGFAPFAENLQQELEDLAAAGYTQNPPRKKPTRPPRYAGPQNKGRSWTQQPPRLARSSCRKSRR